MSQVLAYAERADGRIWLMDIGIPAFNIRETYSTMIVNSMEIIDLIDTVD